MGTKDIELVIIRACESLGVVPLSSIYVSSDFPEGTDERIVIHVKNQMRGDYFYRGFVEVNFITPDIEGRANHERLRTVEDALFNAFRYDSVGEFEGETYRYGLSSIQTLREKDVKYHYANARLLFEILNI